MILKGIKEAIQDSINQSEMKLKDEIYTIKELAEMFKTSRQHMGRLIKLHNLETINMSANKESKKTLRIKKSEVLKLREILSS